MKKHTTLSVTTCALCVALGILLPLAFHWVGLKAVAKFFSPMHLPVFLCGLLAGPWYGLLCGLILPYLSSLLTSMPAAFPNALVMTFEMAAYGCFAGLFLQLLFRKVRRLWVVYPALILAMLAGRAVYGISYAILFALQQTPYSFEAFLSGAFVTTWPAIVTQIILLPAMVFALKKANVLQTYQPMLYAEPAACSACDDCNGDCSACETSGTQK